MNSLQKRLTHFFSKYITKKFNLFPCALEAVDIIKEKEKWKWELDKIFCERIDNIMTETGHWFWTRKNEELVKIQLFYGTIKKELEDLEEFANSLVIVQREALNFDWPDDAAFREWKDQFMSEEKEQPGDEDDDDVEGNATPKNDDEKKEDPQDKEEQQATGGDSSLSNLMATYSEDEE